MPTIKAQAVMANSIAVKTYVSQTCDSEVVT